MRRTTTGSRVGALLAAGALAAAVCGAGPAVAAGSSALRTAPVRACPDEPLPSYLPRLTALAASVPLPAPVDLPQGAAVFGARYPGEAQYLVAPGDWACDVVYFAADGGEVAYVHPGGHTADPITAQYTSLVQAVYNSGGVQTDVDLACPFIPQATAPPRPGAPAGTCLAPPRQGADQLHPVPLGAPGLFAMAIAVPAGVREPNLATGAQAPPTGTTVPTVALVTFASGTAQEIVCAVPGPAAARTCQASLGFFLAGSDLGRKLSSAQLAGAVKDLNAFVASSLG